jgi:sugar phosphate isomerase/epimerase
MQLGIFAKTFAVQGALPVLKAVSAAGYDCAQFNLACLGLPSMPDEIADGVVQEISAASRESCVKISAVSATYNMIHPDPRQRAKGMRRLELIVANAQAMGTSLVTLCTGTRDPYDQWRHHEDNGTPEAWRDLVTEMGSALELAERYGVDLGIEPELANIVSSALHAKRLIAELRSERLKIVLDPANLFEIESAAQRERLVEDSVDLLADRLVMAHAKDRDAAGQFIAAGRGVIDFRHFIGRLMQAGFDGPLVTHGLDEADAPSVAAFLREAMA